MFLDVSDVAARSGRLLSILLFLQHRGSATARVLAAHLEVSLRTIYRDVQILGSMGVPIYAEPGRAGGYRLIDGYRTTLTGLTAQESLALFLIGLPEPAASLGLASEAESVSAKLLAALSPLHREQAALLRDRFLVDLPPWYVSAEVPPALPGLAEAVLAGHRVWVRYRRWEEPREVRRLLDPYGLVVKHGSWYLIAASRTRSKPRTYRVDNLLELKPTREAFERRPGFELGPFWHTQLADFDRRRYTGTARIRLSSRLASRIDDDGDAALRAAAASGEVDTVGRLLVEIPIESADWAAKQLIRYGSDIEVLSPSDVRQALRRLARAALRQHSPRRRQP